MKLKNICKIFVVISGIFLTMNANENNQKVCPITGQIPCQCEEKKKFVDVEKCDDEMAACPDCNQSACICE